MSAQQQALPEKKIHLIRECFTIYLPILFFCEDNMQLNAIQRANLACLVKKARESITACHCDLVDKELANNTKDKIQNIADAY